MPKKSLQSKPGPRHTQRDAKHGRFLQFGLTSAYRAGLPTAISQHCFQFCYGDTSRRKLPLPVRMAQMPTAVTSANRLDAHCVES